MVAATKNYTIKVGVIGNAEFQRFQRGIDSLAATSRKAAAGIKSMGDQMSSMGRLAGLAGKAMAVFYSAQGLKSIIGQADAMRNLEASFSVLLGSGERASAMMSEVFAIAKNTGAPLNDVAEAVQRLSVGLGEMGASNAQITTIADTFIKLGRVGGASMADINGALIQFSQGLSSGRLQGDEFRSISERLPLVMKALATEMGVSVGELKKLGSEGKITSDIMGNAMINAAKGVDAEFKKLPKTFEQASNNLNTMFTEFLSTPAVISAVQGLADIISSATESIRVFAEDVSWAWGQLGEFEKYAIIAATAIGGITIAVKLLMASNPFTLIATGAIAAATLIITNWSRIKEFFMFDLPIGFLQFRVGFNNAMANVVQAAQLGVNKVLGLMQTFGSAILAPINLIRKAMGEDPLNFKLAIDVSTKALAGFATGQKELNASIAAGEKSRAAYKASLKGVADATEKNVGGLKSVAKVSGDAAGGLKKVSESAKESVKEIKKELTVFEELLEQLKKEDAEIKGITEAYTLLTKGRADATISTETYTRALTVLNERAEKLGIIKPPTFFEELKKDIAEQKENVDRIIAAYGDLDAAFASGAVSGADYQRMLEALNDAAEEAGIINRELARVIEDSLGRAIEDSIIGLAKDGKFAFKDMAVSILEDIARMIIKMKILAPLMKSLGLSTGAPTANARGGVYLNGVGNGSPYTPYALGGIINQRTTIGSALMGEAGGGRSEAIIPLRRHGGSLGVGASPVNVNVINNAGAEVKVSESSGNDGSRTIDIMIDQRVKEAMGSGGMDRVMRSRYGLRAIGG
jgi:lambda family phage tail tape measure protein